MTLPGSMKAARFHASGRRLELEEVAVPEPGPADVLVRVEACGICLSDVHLIQGGIPPIIDVVTPGHEACGRIAATGDLVEGLEVGRRVSLMGGKNCGACARCVGGRPEECLETHVMGFHYDGAWAEYLVVPSYTVTAVPDHVLSEHAAIIADAVATPYAALIERAGLRPAEAVGLWGIGGLGTHAVQIARVVGAAPVIAIDPLESARRRALKVGADAAIDPASVDVKSEIMSLTDGIGLDVAVDLVGSNAVLAEATGCLGQRGRCVMVGLSMEHIALERSLAFGVMRHAVLGHLGYSKRAMDELMRLVSTGRIDLTASISDVLPLEEVAAGVERLARKEDDPVRILVSP